MKTTRDTLLGGRVAIEQPADGFRAGTDSILLAASLPEVDLALEAGCGATRKWRALRGPGWH